MVECRLHPLNTEAMILNYNYGQLHKCHWFSGMVCKHHVQCEREYLRNREDYQQFKGNNNFDDGKYTSQLVS